MSNGTMEDTWAIMQAYSRYEQAVTDKQYDVMASIFTEDADLSNRLGTGKGRADIQNRFADRFVDAPATKIMACNHVIDVADDRETARSSVDYLVLEVDPASPSGLTVKQMGRYYDDWRKVDGAWLVSNRSASEPS